MFGESCSFFVEACMLCLEDRIHETHWVMKGAKIPFQKQLFSEKKTINDINSDFFSPLFLFFSQQSISYTAQMKWSEIPQKG